MLPTSPISPTQAVAQTATPQPNVELSDESKMRFEQLLWAELLTHTGLEDALTLGGGDGASMFARYFVEAIAEDIAKQHPLGLLDKELPSAPEAIATEEMKDNG
ncbi:MAG: hypothetical protein AAGJ51_08695 [Pseudomonadota bacterium]